MNEDIMRVSMHGTTEAITPAEMQQDVAVSEYLNDSLYEWSGEDRGGNALRVTWIAGRRTGRLRQAYEVSDRANGGRWYALRTVALIKRELLASETPWQSERLAALVANLADEIRDQRKAMNA